MHWAEKRQILLNFVLNPLLVALLVSLLPVTGDLKFAAALVLLAPCIDYVVVFTGLAGGAKDHLLRATPVLLVGQLIAVPIWLVAFTRLGLWNENLLSWAVLQTGGSTLLDAAFMLGIPFILAWGLQKCGQKPQKCATKIAEKTMVPLMMLVLFSAVASTFGHVSAYLNQLFPLAVIYALLAVIIGSYAWSYTGRQETKANQPARTAVIFSAVTRNSLVVLPIALTLGELTQQPLMPLAVVTQTLVELLVMVLMVKLMTRRAKY